MIALNNEIVFLTIAISPIERSQQPPGYCITAAFVQTGTGGLPVNKKAAGIPQLL